MNLTPEQIRSHRKANGLSQKALAELAGVSEPTVRQHWEKKGITDNQIKEAFVIVGMVSCLEVKADSGSQGDSQDGAIHHN